MDLSSASDKTFDLASQPDATDKLMSPNAVEKPDSVTGSNPQIQFMPDKKVSKSTYGELGKRGHNF